MYLVSSRSELRNSAISARISALTSLRISFDRAVACRASPHGAPCCDVRQVFIALLPVVL